jgi:Fibrobacter succinogenes major domain (Fib_succ_major).
MKKGLFKIAAVALLLTACAGDDVAGGASGDAGVVAVKDWEVAGVSQKGPFVTGSVVTVQELDGITLKQTGKSFKGSIKSDKGDFAIKDINLESQYAILEANGYYRDEISGKKSSGTVTLRAFTDLSNRKTVNINLLTHLEYERVMYLVTEKKKSIAEAKEQAEKEILASFAIEGEFAESEDLNIFKSGDGNAALLAVSVLMQSDVDVAGLTERMGEFSIALAEGGSWDDADTKTAIADWACDVDLKGTIANVRKNVENWKYADSVPSFEKYVTNFWWDNYGLGVCNDKRKNETKRNVNKLSKLYDEYFVCEKGRWHIPDDGKSSSSKTSKSSSSGTAKSSSSKNVEPAETSSSSAKKGSSSSGISYGVLKDSRDGQEYKTVQIGDQVWMAENLNYAVEGSRCYDNDKKNCEKFGRLYNLEQVLDTTSQAFELGLDKFRLRSDFHPRQGVCPDGWHVPEKAEWDTLFAFAEENGDGEKLGSSLLAYDWDDYNEKLNASNKFGFNLIGAGACHEESGCTGLDSLTYVWTATVAEPEYVLMYSFGGPLALLFKQKPLPYAYTNMYVTEKHYASIRCVKGEGKKSHNPEKNVVKSSSSSVKSSSSIASSSSFTSSSSIAASSSSVLSSSSIYNPFDTVPHVPQELAILESSFVRKGHTIYGGGKQEVWLFTSKVVSSESSRDSMASVFIKELGTQGFAFEASVKNDSLDKIYSDSSYVYFKNVGNAVYKVAITKIRSVYGSPIPMISCSFDVKVVVLKDGFEELPTVDVNSLRYETAMPEEVSFLKNFVTSIKKESWNDSLQSTSWWLYRQIDRENLTTETMDDPPNEEKVKALADSVEHLKHALEEKGFVLNKVDSTELTKYYYTYESDLAKYEVIVYVNKSKIGDAVILGNWYYEYSYNIRVVTYYKKNAKRLR